MTRQAWAIVVIGGAATAAIAFSLLRWVPDVPADAASDPVVRTAMTGSSTSAGECLPRIQRPSGYLDACWQADRERSEQDPDKDYYRLHVYGTFGPGTSGSPRWARLAADLVGTPADNVLMAWPSGEWDGPCEQQPVTIGLGGPPIDETICGHTAAAEPEPWTQVVTWTCRGCLIPDDRDRALSLHVIVGVPDGEVPEWDIAVDVGG